MVYVVQYCDYPKRDVVGLYETLPDALICASTHEALTNTPCDVFTMNIHLSPCESEEQNECECVENDEILPTFIKEEIKEKMLTTFMSKNDVCEDSRKANWQHFVDAGGKTVFERFLRRLCSDDYQNLKDKLIDKQITLEEYRERMSEISAQTRSLEVIWETTNAFSIPEVELYIKDVIANYTC
jgi:hypothetical protein